MGYEGAGGCFGGGWEADLDLGHCDCYCCFVLVDGMGGVLLGLLLMRNVKLAVWYGSICFQPHELISRRA